MGLWMYFRCFDCSLFQYLSFVRLKQKPHWLHPLHFYWNVYGFPPSKKLPWTDWIWDMMMTMMNFIRISEKWRIHSDNDDNSEHYEYNLFPYITEMASSQ